MTSSEPVWLSVMRMLVGLQEIPGPKSNPMILNWAKDIDAPTWFHDDDQAWCAVGMNRVLMACQLPMARHETKPDGYDLLRAATFETYGFVLSTPVLGCIMTFKRPEGHHVALYLGENKDAYCVLGANQKNGVHPAWILKERLTAMRWPTGVAIAPYTAGPIMLDMATGQPSVNEQ